MLIIQINLNIYDTEQLKWLIKLATECKNRERRKKHVLRPSEIQTSMELKTYRYGL